jgi:hypothetical protein
VLLPCEDTRPAAEAWNRIKGEDNPCAGLCQKVQPSQWPEGGKDGTKVPRLRTLLFPQEELELGYAVPSPVPCLSTKPCWMTNIASSKRVETPSLSKILVR